MERVRAAEARVAPGATLLTEAVARGYHKLLAYKDESTRSPGCIPTAISSSGWTSSSRATEAGLPPCRRRLADRDPATGELQKKTYGPWMLKAMRLLTRFKGLRGGMLDPSLPAAPIASSTAS